MVKHCRLVLAGVVLGVSQYASALSVAPLAEYNLIVEGSYTHQAGSVYGTGLIGGNLLGGSPAEFASRLETTVEVDSLTVLGDIQNSVHIKTGNVVVGGSIGSGVNVDLQTHGASIKAATAADVSHFDQVISDLKEASGYFASLPSNTDYTVADYTNDWSFSYSGEDQIAVFNGSYMDIFKNNAQIRFADVAAEKLIFNITDSAVNIGNNGWNLPGFDLNGESGIGARDILWNFYQAESVNIQSSGFAGTVLAMYADVNLGSTLDGSIAAKSLVANRQIHDYNFNPPSVNPVPVPASPVLFGFALFAFGAFRRFSKAKKA